MPKRRPVRVRQLKPVFHILCEGEKTEPRYIQSYIDRSFPGCTLIRVEKTDKNTPVQLVEDALRRLAASPDGDVFWVVYDRESPVKYSDELHRRAEDLAKGKVRIALSNVSFEIWLLMHFTRDAAAYDSCDDLLRRSSLKRRWLTEYDKATLRAFTVEEISTARRNSLLLNRQTIRGADASWTQRYQWNPSTYVYELLDAIDGFGRRHCS